MILAQYMDLLLMLLPLLISMTECAQNCRLTRNNVFLQVSTSNSQTEAVSFEDSSPIRERRHDEGWHFRPGIQKQAQAVQDTLLLQSMVRLGRGLEHPSATANRTNMPWDLHQAPLLSCSPQKPCVTGSCAASSLEANADLQQALKIFCNAGLGSLVEFYVDSKFADAYHKMVGADGWIDQAFVAYVGLKSSSDSHGAQMDLLVQSIHHFSSKPVVVTNFGEWVPSTWNSKRFPRMVLMHARSTEDVTQKSFNFNKLTSMLFTKVKTGISLDSDQWVNRGLDYLFDRAAQETTSSYPYPILPVHWMSRDPKSSDMEGYPEGYVWNFQSTDAPQRSMRWGHAHPTWTHFAFPFLARWTSYVLAPDRTSPPQWLVEQGWWEDEDILNVALWAENVTKQWCKFDIPTPDDFEMFLRQPAVPGSLEGTDSKWYPQGIPYVFFTAHAAKDPEYSYKLLEKLWGNTTIKNSVILYANKWFADGQALNKYDPSLRCMV